MLAVVAIGLEARTVELGSEIATARAELDEQAAALAVVVDPAHRTASLSAEPVAPIASADAVMARSWPGSGPQVVFGELWSATTAGGGRSPPDAVRSFVPTAIPAATTTPTTARPRTTT